MNRLYKLVSRRYMELNFDNNILAEKLNIPLSEVKGFISYDRILNKDYEVNMKMIILMEAYNCSKLSLIRDVKYYLGLDYYGESYTPITTMSAYSFCEWFSNEASLDLLSYTGYNKYKLLPLEVRGKIDRLMDKQC